MFSVSGPAVARAPVAGACLLVLHDLDHTAPVTACTTPMSILFTSHALAGASPFVWLLLPFQRCGRHCCLVRSPYHSIGTPYHRHVPLPRIILIDEAEEHSASTPGECCSASRRRRGLRPSPATLRCSSLPKRSSPLGLDIGKVRTCSCTKFRSVRVVAYSSRSGEESLQNTDTSSTVCIPKEELEALKDNCICECSRAAESTSPCAAAVSNRRWQSTCSVPAR